MYCSKMFRICKMLHNYKIVCVYLLFYYYYIYLQHRGKVMCGKSFKVINVVKMVYDGYARL